MKVEITQKDSVWVEVVLQKNANPRPVYRSSFIARGPLDMDWVKEAIAEAYEVGFDAGRRATMIDRKQLAEQIAELAMNELGWADSVADAPREVKERRKKEALRTIRALVRAGLEEVYNEAADMSVYVENTGKAKAYRYSLSVLRGAVKDYGRTSAALRAVEDEIVSELSFTDRFLIQRPLREHKNG